MDRDTDEAYALCIQFYADGQAWIVNEASSLGLPCPTQKEVEELLSVATGNISPKSREEFDNFWMKVPIHERVEVIQVWRGGFNPFIRFLENNKKLAEADPMLDILDAAVEEDGGYPEEKAPPRSLPKSGRSPQDIIDKGHGPGDPGQNIR